MTDGTIISLFNQRVDELKSKPALRQKTEAGRWRVLSWTQYGTEVRALSRALAAEGVVPGDGVAVLSSNRYEYQVADLAGIALGAVAVPIYHTNSPEQVKYVLEHSDSKIVFCEDAEQCAKVAQVRGELSNLKKVVTFSDGEADTTYADMIDKGRELDAADPDAYRTSSDAVQPDALACLIYTSGTTGPPKGAMLTHHNVVWTCGALSGLVDTTDVRTLSFLPLAHIAERVVSHYGQIYFGSETWFGGGTDTLREDLAEVQPTIFFAVPRLFEKFEAALRQRFAETTGIKGSLARANVTVNSRLVEAEQGGPKAKALDGFLGPILARVVGTKVRTELGLDQLTDTISGAAPITRETLVFFHAMGIPVREVYGQTEDCGPTSLMPRSDVRLGTVGRAIPGDEVRIADDGEILVKGDNVFEGYFKNPEATAETVVDGWLHSGDLGQLDKDGFLSIVGRKKDLIITAGGKNVSPQNIEASLKAHDVIGQAVVIGDARKFLSALVTLDPDGIEHWAKENGLPADPGALVTAPETQQLVQGIVDEVNASLSKVESIKKFTILPADFTQETGELTPTLKVKRHVVGEKYAGDIEAMYG